MVVNIRTSNIYTTVITANNYDYCDIVFMLVMIMMVIATFVIMILVIMQQQKTNITMLSIMNI